MHKIRALGRRLTGRPRMIVYLVIAGLTCWSAAAGAAYYFMGWADKYFVGTIFADIKEGSNTGGTYGEYNGPDKAWATIGIQTRAGQANAVSRASFYIRDRSTTKCGTLHVVFSRYHLYNAGPIFAEGSTCPVFQSNYDLDGTPVELVRYTCEFPNGPADQYLATQFMEISHAGASEYLPPSGDVRWQYLTRMWSTWGVPGDTGHSESWSCFGIYWTT